MKNLTILCTVLLLASCAFHSGTISTSVTNEPVVHKDVAIGVSTANIFLNIGGLGKNALVHEARKNMIHSRPLQGSEQYNNITVDVKTTYYLLGRKTKVTMVADVVAPKDSLTQASYSEEYLIKMRQPLAIDSLFAIGDSVYFNSSDIGQIIHLRPADGLIKAEISYLDVEGYLCTKKVHADKLFALKKEHNGLLLNERTSDGIIIGFGTTKMLVSTVSGTFVVRYPKQ